MYLLLYFLHFKIIVKLGLTYKLRKIINDFGNCINKLSAQNNPIWKKYTPLMQLEINFDALIV